LRARLSDDLEREHDEKPSAARPPAHSLFSPRSWHASCSVSLPPRKQKPRPLRFPSGLLLHGPMGVAPGHGARAVAEDVRANVLRNAGCQRPASRGFVQHGARARLGGERCPRAIGRIIDVLSSSPIVLTSRRR
jgi:hypothetical protein